MKINDHFLTDTDPDSQGINRTFTTPNISGKSAEGLPDTIVIHFTAGSSAESSAKHLSTPSAKASAHLVVGRDGEIYQLAPFNVITWHAGRSSWKGRTGLNKYSVGIEIDNAGRLTRTESGSFKTWFGREIPAADVFQGKHRNESAVSYWHEYTETQIQKVFEICELLVEKYGIKNIVGHEEIAPKRKEDPGPAFPLDRLRERLIGDNRKSEEGELSGDQEKIALVNASKLNIRNGPGVAFPKISEPIRRGETVSILGVKNGWTQVEYIQKGWVSSQYLEKMMRE